MSIEKNLLKLKKQLKEINDVPKVTKEIAEMVQFIAQQGFKNSQTTESIDEKIQALIQTVQDLANTAINFHNKKEKEVEILNIKIELLEKIIEENNKQATEVHDIITDIQDLEDFEEITEDEKKEY